MIQNRPLLKVRLLTIFPEAFPGMLGISVVGKALENKIWDLQVIDIRNFALNNRKSVDDYPYGGGAGMVMRPDVIADAIDSSFSYKDDKSVKFVYLSPRGELLNQKKVRQLSKEKELFILCGRYEGVDQRVIDEYRMEEISVGDYILSGGEIAACALLDAVVRNLPEVLGSNESLVEESFGNGEGSVFDNLLEYPHYTKPAVWRDIKVPEVLVSGHHKKINEWRLEQAKKITLERNLKTKS